MRYRTNTHEIIYLIISVIYLFAVISDHTVFSEYTLFALAFRVLRYLCYVVAVVKILMDGHRTHTLLSVFLVLVFIAASAYFSGNKTFAFYFLMIFAAREISIRKLILVSCYVQGIVLTVCIILSQLGVVQDYIFDPNKRVRHGLGFTWTTTAPILFLFFTMSYIYLRKEKMHAVEYAILEGISIWFYVKTDAKMSFFLGSAMLAVLFVLRFLWQNQRKGHGFSRLLIAAPVVMCAIAIAIHAMYDGTQKTWQSLNKLLAHRLQLGHDALDKYGITLFGQPIRWVGFKHGASTLAYNYVDCSYLQIMLESGLAALVIIVFFYVYIMYMASKKRDYFLQTLIFFIVVFSITEPRLMNLGFNPFPFFAAGFFCVDHGELAFQDTDSKVGGIQWISPHVTLRFRQ